MRGWGWFRIGIAVALCVGLGFGASEGAAQDEGRFAALMAEVEALMAQAPEVEWLAEVSGEIGPAAAGQDIAGLLAEAGRYAEAERIAAGISRSTSRNWAYEDFALSLARDGQVLRAYKSLDSINDTIQLSEALRGVLKRHDATDKVAIVLIGAEEKAAALKVVKRVVALARRLDDPERLDQALSEAAGFYLDLDEIDAATAMIDQVESEAFRIGWLDKRVQKLVEAGDFAEAERLADTIAQSDPDWSWTYWSIADGLAAAGQPAEARRVLMRLEHPRAQVSGLTQIAVNLANTDPEVSAEFLAEAEALAEAIADRRGRVRALGLVAAALAKTGEGDKAQALAAQLIAVQAEAGATCAALASIASSLDEAGLGDAASRVFDAAESQVVLIGDAEARDSAHWTLAWHRTELGQYVEAERLAVQIVEANTRVLTLERLGVALAGTGQESEARRIAAVISDTDGSKELLGEGLDEIAEALAAMGAVDAAEAVIGDIVSPASRAHSMTKVAAALAKRGHLSEAERIARRIEDPAWRAVALGAVAAGL